MPADRSTSPASSSAAALPNACKRCRHRKKRCDRVRPRCANCISSRADCVYEPLPGDPQHQKILINELTAKNEAQQRTIDSLQDQVAKLTADSWSAAAQVQSILKSPTIASGFDVNITSPSSGLTVDPSWAEMIVYQVFDGEVDALNTQQSLLAGVAHHLGMPVDRQGVETNSLSLPFLPARMINKTFLPDENTSRGAIAAYFDYTNCLHPVLERETVDADMKCMYGNGAPGSSLLDSITGPDLRVFRFFMVLAIGINILPHCETGPSPALLRACASAHFAAALRTDTLTGMVCIVLYCIVSLTDSSTMDPFQNVRRACRLVIEFGFHRDDNRLAWNVRELRKKIFWSIFGMDRSISFTLIRNPMIPEEIIATSLPAGVPDLSPLNTAFLSPLAFFQHSVLLRRLQGVVVTEVNTAMTDQSDREETIIKIRNQIDSWYDSLPRQHDRVHPYVEVNYNMLLVRLYAPAGSRSHVSKVSLPCLRQSAYKVIEQYSQGLGDHRVSKNHLTLSHMITCCMALLYALQNDDPTNMRLVSWRKGALRQLEEAEQLVESFCSQSNHSRRYAEAFRTLSSNARERINSCETEATFGWDPATCPPPTSGVLANIPLVAPNPQQEISPNADFVLPWDLPDFSLTTETQPFPQLDPTAIDIDRFLASFDMNAFST